MPIVAADVQLLHFAFADYDDMQRQDKFFLTLVTGHSGLKRDQAAVTAMLDSYC